MNDSHNLASTTFESEALKILKKFLFKYPVHVAEASQFPTTFRRDSISKATKISKRILQDFAFLNIFSDFFVRVDNSILFAFFFVHFSLVLRTQVNQNELCNYISLS